ncbi:hypothetical protein NWF32_31135 [Pseudomonas qingdaonensis]|nr:hypothetical protein [Pseudomonas qingdaonensis]
MRTRCPNCGTTLSLDALIAHDGAREALGIAFKMSGPLGHALQCDTSGCSGRKPEN